MTTTLLEENTTAVAPEAASNHVRMRMLQQMSEALEDEASSLLLRTAGCDEEELLLTSQIDDRQTEINRFQLRLQAVRSERDGLLDKVERLRAEARAMREEAYDNEDEIALSVMDDVLSEVEQAEPRGPIFFQRSKLAGNGSR